MKKIGLVVKKDERARAVAEETRVWLEEGGYEVMVKEPEPITSGAPETRIGRDIGPLDLVVVLGGDGTLLYAARTFGLNGTPLLGVNLGGLGFLTEVGLENLKPALGDVLSGEFSVEARMMLSIEVFCPGRGPAGYTVLNDVVINKGALARILGLRVKVDDYSLGLIRADGLIISTPTGSTAYNLAAGGPIVHPAHETIILTPICPFTLSNRPLILPVNSVIAVGFDPGATDVLLTSDGQVSCPLGPEDTIVVKRSENSISLIKNPYKNYFEILRTKLGWG
ncbi:MAG: NAD(+)/NADH kinase [Thermodesulfobacteriota bacterium]